MTRMDFDSLESAVSFISTRLEANDFDALLRQCEPEPDDPRAVELGLPTIRERGLMVLAELKRRHASRDLRSLYAGRKFPDGDTAFKLGGHDAELGHIHIDFARSVQGWRLRQIWMCR